MCSFLSAIYKQDGSIICLPEYTDSHEDLIAHAGLDDSKDPALNRWIRVEFTPPDKADVTNPDEYTLKVDEPSTPVWFDDDARADCIAQMSARIRAMVVKDKHLKIILGGCWILAGNTQVDRFVDGRVFRMLGASQVGTMWGASKVGTMRGASQVGTMWDTSQVGTMWGASKVGTMWDTSQVGTMWETSKVGEMWGTSKVGEMRGTSKVGTMWETSQVGTMWETSQVGTMRGTSKVGTMWETSQVGTMRDTSQVGTMWGASKVGTDKRTKAQPCQ